MWTDAEGKEPRREGVMKPRPQECITVIFCTSSDRLAVAA